MEYDRTLTATELMQEMGFNKWEATKFMARFGHKNGYRTMPKIGWRELMFLQLDGTVAQWVKENCAEGRRTVSERKGTA